MLNVATLLRVKNKWLGGRRGADVRAVTHMKVLVLSSNQMQWVLEHDYGVHGEMGAIINERTQQLEKSKSNRESKAAKAKQAPEKKRPRRRELDIGARVEELSSRARSQKRTTTHHCMIA